MNNITDYYTMSNGVNIPCVGFGTWQTPDGKTAIDSVKTAVDCGYRHIDTAAIYRNERSIGLGIEQCGIPREQLFITSKVWNTERGYKKTKEAFSKTLSDLRLDYLDLYLIHWPSTQKNDPNWKVTNLETWRAMEELYDEGKIRAIGVSNFLTHHIKAIMDEANIMPMVNQIELHIGYRQQETVDFCKSNGIVVEAWSPLGTGRVLKDTRVIKMADKYGVSAARLCIRWCLQNGLLPLPKSITPSRIEENTKVFDFEISQNDMGELNSISGLGFSGFHPDKIDF